MKMQRFISYYTRDIDKRIKNAIFIFTDNCNRTSGNIKIPDDSSYSKRFGKTGLCHPTVTSAMLRGLERAFPITTQKTYVKGAKRFDGNWCDDDLEEFKKVIDDDFEEIKKACVKYNPEIIYFPNNGVLNGSISRLTLERTPLLFEYIIKKEIELRDFINELNKNNKPIRRKKNESNR